MVLVSKHKYIKLFPKNQTSQKQNNKFKEMRYIDKCAIFNDERKNKTIITYLLQVSWQVVKRVMLKQDYTKRNRLLRNNRHFVISIIMQ